MEEVKVFIAPLVIIILGFVVYANSLNGEFVNDDVNFIKNNVFIKNWSYLPQIFTEDIGRGAGLKYYYYRPLHIFTYRLIYTVWKLDVKPYHLINILYHILAALTLYWFITILFKNKVLSLFASILFVVHPIHTEAVAYISGIIDPMATLFILLCLVFYIKQLNSEHLGFSILASLCYILALLSKEHSLILPVLMLLYHFTFKREIKFTAFTSFFGITLIYGIFRFVVLKSVQLNIPVSSNLIQRIPGFFVAIFNYIGLLILPFNLHREYGDLLFNFSEPRALLGCIATLLLLIWAFRRREKNNLVFFSVFWFLIALLPVSNLYPLSVYMAEHYIYIPSIGFFLLLAYGLNFLFKTKNFKIFAVGATIVLVTFHSYLTFKQNDYWREPITFYERTLKYGPHTQRVLCGLGNAYTDADRYEKAILAYSEALEVDPTYAKAYNNLGYVYATIGKREEARTLFEKAVAIDPNYATPYCNLGSLYAITGRNRKAIELFKKAIEIDPYYALAHNNLAAAHYFERQYDLAIRHCGIALKLGYNVNPELLEFLKPHRK